MIPSIKNTKQAGFTLIELVLVLVLIGILSAVALPRLSIGNKFYESLETEKLIGLLRQAQLRAMNDPQAVLIGSQLSRCAKVVITDKAFSLAENCDSGLLTANSIKQHASRGLYVGALSLTISANTGLPMILQFGEKSQDADYLSAASLLGRPFVNGEPLTNKLTLTIAGKDVYIEAEGYIHGP